MFRGIHSAPVRSAIVSDFIIALSMTISLAGLTNLIKYGYGYCGCLGITVVIVPFLTVGVYKNRKYIKAHGETFMPTEPESFSIQKTIFLGYTVGPGSYSAIAAVCAPYGKKVVVMGGKRPWRRHRIRFSLPLPAYPWR